MPPFQKERIWLTDITIAANQHWFADEGAIPVIQWRNLTNLTTIWTPTYTTLPADNPNYTGNLTANETLTVHTLPTFGTIEPLSRTLRTLSQRFFYYSDCQYAGQMPCRQYQQSQS